MLKKHLTKFSAHCQENVQKIEIDGYFLIKFHKNNYVYTSRCIHVYILNVFIHLDICTYISYICVYIYQKQS